MLQESEEIALLRKQLASATANRAGPEQDAGASDQNPFDAQVADQKTLFSDFIEHLPIGLCLVGNGGEVLMSNPAYSHFLPDMPVPSLVAPQQERGRWRSWDKDSKPVPRDQFVGARAARGELVRRGEYRAGGGAAAYRHFGGSAYPLDQGFMG